MKHLVCTSLAISFALGFAFRGTFPTPGDELVLSGEAVCWGMEDTETAHEWFSAHRADKNYKLSDREWKELDSQECDLYTSLGTFYTFKARQMWIKRKTEKVHRRDELGDL